MPRSFAAFSLVVMVLSAVPASPQVSGEIQLSTPVRLELRRLQESWQNWTRAYFQDDEEQGRNSLSQLLSIAETLGMEKLPDQSAATAAFAVRSAREGNVDRARWAVDCARQLDPGRPEADFAAATVERLAGNYPGLLTNGLKGYVKLLRLPLAGHIWRQNLGLGTLYVLLLAGALFIVLLTTSKGAELYYDVARLVSPPLPRAGADAVALALLVWPIFLSSGLLWLALYWSILLWGYATLSQRGVLIFLWLVFGLSPVAVTYHQREIRDALLPPIRAVENLKQGRVYGNLFLDLEALRHLMGESPIVTEITADLYRDLGQWEHARVIYIQMIEEHAGQPVAASAYNNIGVFHHRRKDYGTAVNFFTDATTADPELTEAFYNLSRAYFEDFKFTEAHTALAQAKSVDGSQVALWENPESGLQGDVIPTDGGLARAAEIRRTLEQTGPEGEAKGLFSRAYVSLAAAIAAAVLAVALDRARRRKGYPSSRFTGRHGLASNRWLLALVPGWPSTLQGRGVRAFLALLVVSPLLLVPFVRGWGYRIYLGNDAGPGLATLMCLAALVLYFAIRLVRSPRTVS